jgi:TrmH family RNA methyltransferase
MAALLTFTGCCQFVRLKRMVQSGKTAPKHAVSASPMEITSRDNRWLKRFRSLLAGEREDDGIVGVEGLRMVEAALGSGLHVEALLVSDSGERHMARLAPLLPASAQILQTSDRLFAAVADTHVPQGIAAMVQTRQANLGNLLRGSALVVVLVGVQDPGNVGTILRAAEAFGATGAATCSADALGTSDPFGPKALRASAGSALRLPVLHGLPAASLLSKLRASEVKLYAATKEDSEETPTPGPASLRPWEADWKSPAAILIGNEGAGLPEDIVRRTDARVTIPQAAASTPVGVESLNAAMAATVLLYEAMRQRMAQR